MRIHLQFDGACKGNPGPMGIGAVLEGPEGIVEEISERLPKEGTNNIAEYTAVLRGLERVKHHGAKQVVIEGDSRLVVNQLLGKFRVTNPGLKALHKKVLEIASGLDDVEIRWIPRERNAKADALANKALKEPKSGKQTLGSKPSKREHSALCPRCGKPCTFRIQVFKDGSEHIRQECPEHGYIGYAPNVEPFLSLARQGR